MTEVFVNAAHVVYVEEGEKSVTVHVTSGDTLEVTATFTEVMKAFESTEGWRRFTRLEPVFGLEK